jgi:hypothetical protein
MDYAEILRNVNYILVKLVKDDLLEDEKKIEYFK